MAFLSRQHCPRAPHEFVRECDDHDVGVRAGIECWLAYPVRAVDVPMESRRFRERLDTLGARRDDESTGTDVPPDAPAPFRTGGAEETHGSSRTRRRQNYRNRVPPTRQANSELLCSLESSMSSRRSARTHSARFPANGRSEFRKSWGGAVGGNGNGGTPDRGHLRRYAITDQAMLKDAGEQLAAPATQLAPAKANGYVILAHVPLYLR